MNRFLARFLLAGAAVLIADAGYGAPGDLYEADYTNDSQNISDIRRRETRVCSQLRIFW